MEQANPSQTTICAIATAPGRGGVGIVRVSGPLAASIAKASTGLYLKPRYAHFCEIKDQLSKSIDHGIALFFAGPHSFTGEDVFEFQGHGGPVVLDLILQRFLQLGAVIARPGEFSERAFLNDKMDLAQAEAIADLIDANSVQAAKNAMHSLRGEFSQHIDKLVDDLTHLRLYVESAIDFPEEEIDFLGDGLVMNKLSDLLEHSRALLALAQQGAVIREGMKVVLAGRPNAGKSTLLNALAEKDAAIVSDFAGTTRDTLTEHIHIDGMPLHITDTAGIRDTDNEVERIGIDRAWRAIRDSDRILLLVDATNLNSEELYEEWSSFFKDNQLRSKLTVVVNKIDLSELSAQELEALTADTIFISAKSRQNLPALKKHLLATMGLNQATEGQFSARRRHIDAIERARASMQQALEQLQTTAAGELIAEDLKLAQECLGEITGRLHPDDLLGKIFSSFCIGK